MYVLYGGWRTRSVGPRMVLEEGGLAYRHEEVDIRAGEHRTPDFLALNPAGYVPALVTPEGQVLHEAAAIMLYLADRHGLDHLAPGPRDAARGPFLSKLFYLTNDIQPPTKRYYYPDRYSSDEADTPRIKARALAMAKERWSVLDLGLAARGPYLLGDRFSLADLYMAIYAAYGFQPPEDFFADFPAVKACYDLVAARPKVGPLLKDLERKIER